MTLPVWRSMLFVPALNDRFIEGAPRRGADCIQIDLEDSIPPEFKDRARDRVPAAAAQLASHGLDVVVRINRPWRIAIRDLEASVGPHVMAINLPKVPNAAHVRAVSEILDDLELGYAITVHKAQGSQWPRVIVPLTGHRLLDRTLVYTAVTRAQRQVLLVGDAAAAKKAVEGLPRAHARQVSLDLILSQLLRGE